MILYCSQSYGTIMSTSSMPASLYAKHTACNIMFLVGLWSKMQDFTLAGFPATNPQKYATFTSFLF